MSQEFARYFINRLNALDAATVEAMSQRVSEFHQSAPPGQTMPYPLYFEFLLALAFQAMAAGHEVVVLADGYVIQQPDGQRSAMPFAVDSPGFQEFCQQRLHTH